MPATHPLVSVCRIWDFGTPIPPGVAPRVDDVPCFLQQAHFELTSGFFGFANPNRLLYVPARTDVRWDPFAQNGDLIEMPKGSGTWYLVTDVQDLRRDTPEEERRALMIWTQQTVFPIP